MKPFAGENQKKEGKHDGFKPELEKKRESKKNPPKYENHDGKPID